MVNDYPLDKYYNNWKNGLTPSQQLWGKVELDNLNVFEVTILPHEKYKFLNKIGNVFHIQHLDQQIRVLFKLKEIDIIYAPFAAATTKLLLILKLLGIINKPIVAMIHYPLLGSNSKNKIIKYFGRHLVKGFNRLVFISHKIKSENVKAFSPSNDADNKRFVHLNWGAESLFYQGNDLIPIAEKENYAVSVGQTDRDFDTLIEAFKSIDFNLKIYSRPGYVPKVENITDNVQIYTSGVTYKELLEIYKNSRMILICFKMTQQSTLGVTSLLDALAMGKPVVITENDYIDIDVEKERIGFIVPEDDVNAWVIKVKYLLKNPETCLEFGENALKLQKEKYNMEIFGEHLNSVFEELYLNKKF